MLPVLQMRKTLEKPPVVERLPGWSLRAFAGPRDIEPWLELRRRAFAREGLGVGEWTVADFEREFMQKPWWSPQQMWLIQSPGESSAALAAAVTIAIRGSGEAARPAVHWLLVHPRYRRQGLGRWLLQTLEAAAWENGSREVVLETHVRWKAAVRLYENLGYRPADA